MKIQELVSVLNPAPLQWLGKKDGEIGHITTQAQSVVGDSLFVAIEGNAVDGHRFLPEVMARGAAAVIVQKASSLEGLDTAGRPVLIVEDTRKAIAQVSAAYFNYPWRKMTVVGITGTNGKTTTTYLCESIAKREGLQPAVMGTIETRCKDWVSPSKLTTPAPPLLHELLSAIALGGATHLFTEISSHALDQQRFHAVDVAVAAFSNLTQDHLDYHKTMERYFESKAKLFTEYLDQTSHPSPAAVINVDDRWGRELLSRLSRRARSITYAIDAPEALVKVNHYELGLRGIRAEIALPGGTLCVDSPLIGKHNLYNIVCAVAVSEALGFSAEAVAEGIAVLKAVPGRLESVQEGQSFGVFVDYAHTDDALSRVLSALKSVAPKSRIITVFGCGGDRDSQKRPLMARAVAAQSDYAIITSDNPRTEAPSKIIEEIVGGIPPSFKKGVQWCVIEERRAAIEEALSMAQENDVVLIAGKGHEAYQIVGKTRFPFDDRHVAREWLRWHSIR